MKLFKSSKKQKDESIPLSDWFSPQASKNNNERKPIQEMLTHSDKDGELPFGWIYQNRDFIEKIQNEYSFFLNNWIMYRAKNTRQEYAALKSFIQYMKDVKKLCDSKGECFSFWRSNILFTDDYFEQRQNDLLYLEEHRDELLEKENFVNLVLPTLSNQLLKIIKENPQIKQTDVYKKFDENIKEYISTELYRLEKNNRIIREKSGRTYSITIRE